MHRLNVKGIYAFLMLILICYPFVWTFIEFKTGNSPTAYNFERIISISSSDHDSKLYPLGPITKDLTLTQSFVSKCDSIVKLQLCAGTYIRKNNGSLIIKLIDEETEEIIYTWEKDLGDLIDNAWFELECEEAYEKSGMMNRKYIIEISSPEAVPGNAIALYAYDGDEYSEGDLSINGKLQNGDLQFIVDGLMPPKNLWYVKLWLRIYLIVFLGIILYAIKNKFIIYQNTKARR